MHPGHFLCHFLFDQVHGDHPPDEAPPLRNGHERRDSVRVDSGCVSGVSALLLLCNRSEASQDGLLRGLAAARRRRLHVRDRQPSYSLSVTLCRRLIVCVLNRYHVIVAVLVYLLPLALMAATYSRVGLTLWGGGFPGQSSGNSQDHLQAKRKVLVLFCGSSHVHICSFRTAVLNQGRRMAQMYLK